MTANQTCSNCKAYNAASDEQGECRHFPPVMHYLPNEQKKITGYVRFPIVAATWWCNQFVPRLAVMS